MSELPLGVYQDHTPPSSSNADAFPFVPAAKQEFDITRSEPMQYVSITIPNEMINDSIRALGYFGRLHVVDLTHGNANSKHALAFKKRTAEVVDLEKRLAALEDQIKQRNIPIPFLDLVGDGNKPGANGSSGKVHHDVVVGAGEFVSEVEQALLSNVLFERKTQRDIASCNELKTVLTECRELIPPEAKQGGVEEKDMEEGEHHDDDVISRPGQAPNPFSSSSYSNPDEFTDEGHGPGDRLSSYICGVIPMDQQANFARTVYRISAGANAYTKFAPVAEELVDPTSGEKVHKSVFCVVTIGQQLHKRISKLCAPFGATIYRVPAHNDPNAFNAEIARLEADIRDRTSALTSTSETICNILRGITEPRTRPGATHLENTMAPIRLWQQQLYREKLMIDTLIRCDFHATLAVMGGWCPVNALNDLEYCLSEAVAGQGARLAIDRNAVPPPTLSTPPTSVPVNKFTTSFQTIVNTYGMPRYREYNPGLFTIITFPFLYGVMYGDIGHGTIIGIFGLMLILLEDHFDRQRENREMGEMMEMIYSGRYMIFLMGIFAVYNGIIYNDCMSIPLDLYGSNFHIDKAVNPRYKIWNGEVYPLGVDPAWYHSKNQLQFFNSMKMKIAVILGVIHMSFGIVISLYNHIYFKNILAIYFEFIPRLLFLLCTFGYMITMIVIKWCLNWDSYVGVKPPNLIQTMINMFLSPGSVDKAELLYNGQPALQVVLVLVAVLCVPMMLCPKPIIEHQKRHGGCRALACCHSPADDEYMAEHGNDSEHALFSAHDDIALNHPDVNLIVSPSGSTFPGSSSASVTAMPSVPSMMPDMISSTSAAMPVDLSHNVSSASTAAAPAGGHEEHTLGDAMIHQSIHTIEFVLGAISNTASYLRLWALSLAHAQLAEVFWEKMIMEYGLNNSGVFGFIGLWVWMAATFGVLLCMDVLECFLHALRLHWVEFQNKFYGADGIAFKPFTFAKVESD